MFSRAAKSVVKSLGSRQIHIGEKNFKSWTIKKSCSTKVNHPNATINNARTDNNIAHNLQEDNGKSQTDQLVEALYRLPIAEEVSSLNSSLIPNEIMPKAANVCSRMRPCARIIISEMDPSGKAWQRDYTIAAICKRFPDMMYLPFQEYDISFISETKNFKNHQSIKRKKRNKDLFRVAKNNFLSNYEKPTTELMEEYNAEIFSNKEARYGITGKSTNWIKSNFLPRSFLSYEICNHGRRYSWFLIKALMSANNVSINLVNNFLSKNRNIIGDKGTKRYFFINCKNNDTIVVLNRNSKAITGDTLNAVEEENWIQRTSCKIKSILPDLHAKIRSRLTTVLNLYCSGNIFAVNESIPISEVISNRIFFASKGCDSKSSIRRKIEELCTRKKSSRKNEICKKRERSCKTAEKKCQKKEKTCGKKEVDCSVRRKRTCKEQRKEVSCTERKDLPDKKDVRDCHKTREVKPEEESSKGYKDCDTSKVEEDFCPEQSCEEPKQTSCSKSTITKQTEKDTCEKSKKDECQESYDENDKCARKKKRKKDEDEKASCKQDQEKKKTDKEKKKSEKSDCSEIKKIDSCKKKECPTVVKAPGCSDDDKKTDDKKKTCRKYSTYASQNSPKKR